MELIGLDRIREVVDHDVAFHVIRDGLVALAGGDVVAPTEILMNIAPSGWST